MDVKSWFEEGTNLQIRELRYLKSPPLPYNLFIDEVIHRGADRLNNINEHNITIEHYSELLNENEEKIIDSFLKKEKENGKFDNYTKNRTWLSEEAMFLTLYELSPFLIKIRKEN